ncbi:MAG: winged helix-turn-helix domain-containing protein [Acidobacteriota bacterium]
MTDDSTTRSELPTPFRFGPWLVEPRRLLLRSDTDEVRIEPRAMSVLTYLAARASEVVGREELAQTVWSDVTVCDAAITQAIVRLRRALGDDPKQPTFIETVPKIGYRIIAAVVPVDHGPAVSQATRADLAEPVSTGPTRIVGAGLLAMTLIGCLIAFDLWPVKQTAAKRPQASAPSATTHEPQVDALLAEARRRLDLRTAQDLERAEEAYRRLLALQPDDGRAEAGLARLAAVRADLRLGDRFELYHEARSRAEKALTVDPRLADAHLALATTGLLLDWNLAQAYESSDLALRLAPDDPDGHQIHAWTLSVRGEHVAAERTARRATELDPASASRRADLAFVLLIGGQTQTAIAEAKAALVLEEAHVWACVVLARAHLAEGNEEAAQETMLRLVRPGAGTPEDALATLDYWTLLGKILPLLPADEALTSRASASAQAGDLDQALAFLEAAFAQRDWEVLWLEHLPELASLRQEDRFRNLLRRRNERLRS